VSVESYLMARLAYTFPIVETIVTDGWNETFRDAPGAINSRRQSRKEVVIASPRLSSKETRKKL